MGYSTDFYGQLIITPQPKPEHVAYINKFSETRRMSRIAELTAKRPDPIREAVGLPVGIDGAYFVGAEGSCGQEWDRTKYPDLSNSNSPPGGQPGLWCQWCIDEWPENEFVLQWNGTEKFYDYVEWLEYLINNFFEPWGYKLNGCIEWQGEDRDDMGMIEVTDNKVGTKVARITYD